MKNSQCSKKEKISSQEDVRYFKLKLINLISFYYSLSLSLSLFADPFLSRFHAFSLSSLFLSLSLSLTSYLSLCLCISLSLSTTLSLSLSLFDYLSLPFPLFLTSPFPSLLVILTIILFLSPHFLGCYVNTSHVILLPFSVAAGFSSRLNIVGRSSPIHTELQRERK